MSTPAPKPRRRVLNRKSFQDRFWSFVPADTDPGACWEWRGKRGRQVVNGKLYDYGIFTIPVPGRDPRYTQQIKAHRMAWELANALALGPEDAVLHRCDNPPCVNPSHLMRGTQLENIADMVAKDRQARWRPDRTHCRHGHDLRLPGAITVVSNRGKRFPKCVECGREAVRRHDQRRRGAA